MINSKNDVLKRGFDIDFADSNIYDIAWYAYYLYNIRKLNKHSEIVTTLSEEFNSLLMSGDDKLKIILYNRKTSIGLLLGYYILRKIKFLSPRYRDLKIIYEVIKKYDWYDYDGETLYVLELLTKNHLLKIDYNEVHNIINEQLSSLQKNLENYKLTINEVTSLCYLTLSETFKNKPRTEIEKVLFSNYFQSKVYQSIETHSIFIYAVSQYILSYPRKLLIKRAKDLFKILREMTSLEYSSNSSLSIRAKLRLAKYYYKKAKKRLTRYIKLKKERTIMSLEIIISNIFTFLVTATYYEIPPVSSYIRNVPYFNLVIISIYLSLLFDIPIRAFSGSSIIKKLIGFAKILLKRIL